jgi:hypothetical protein
VAKQPNWKIELTKMHLDWIKKESPNFFEASGGYSMKIKPYSDSTTNGLTRCIKDFLTYLGHYVIRTNRQGQARVERVLLGGSQSNIHGKNVKSYGKVTFTKNSEEKAFTDLQASLWGKFVSIEVKCAATKDKFKKGSAQDENKTLVEKSGGIHIIAISMDQFYDIYFSQLIKLKNE